MKQKCIMCGSVNSSDALYCSKCGAKILPPQIKQNAYRTATVPTVPAKSTGVKAGAIIAIILAVIQILLIVFPVAITLSLQGADFGIFDFDDIVFEFLKALGNRLTEYQRAVKTIRRVTMLSNLLLIPVCIGLFIGAKKKFYGKATEKLPMSLVASVFSHFGLLSSLFLLFLYDYGGFSRTLTFIIFFLSAILCLVADIFMARRLGGYTILVMLFGLLVAALITTIYVPLIGVLVATFGDVFLIFGIFFMMAGSAGGSSSVVYVVII